MIQRYLPFLTEFVALKSVSTDAAYDGEIAKTVTWLTALFEQHEFEVTLLTSPDCNPIVVARYDAGKPTTTLVYGHYDVQPAALEQGWESDPFELREADGRLIARGVADNKGQILTHMVAVFEHAKAGTLATNVTFMIEGNEETANPVLGGLIEAHLELLSCDNVLISDGEIMGDRPALEATLRGGSNMRVRVQTGRTDLHSGLAGGIVPNSAKVLADLLATLSDANGKVLVAGFYDGITAPSDDVRGSNAHSGADITPASYGVKELLSANNTDPYTQVGLYPTVQISGITSGYTGEGFANIIPAQAEARLNLRTVVGQNPTVISRAIADHLRAKAPSYASIEIEIVQAHDAVELDIETAAAKRTATLLREAYGKEVAVHYVGGAIPIVADFKRLLRCDPLLVGFANDDCNMHGANENFRIDLIEKALNFSSQWFSAPF